MKYYFPDYIKDFVCLADKCPDTCCAMWEICIDDDTLEYYKNVPGEFGVRLKNSIVNDEDGDPVFRLNGRRCPFLNNDNLCDIHIKLGEEHTCEVCREHPRFTEIYDCFTEISLSASCPAANDLIFGTTLKKSTYPVPEYDGKDELLNALVIERTCLLDLLAEAQSTEEMSQFLRLQTKKVSDRLYEYNDAFDAFFIFDSKSITDFEKMLLTNSEILTEEWCELLKIASEKELPEKDFTDYCVDNISDLRKAYSYFVYRYFLKAVNDEENELNSAFISLCLFLSADVAAKTHTEYKECFRVFSKEIEHDTDNIEIIKDYIADKGYYL